MKRIVLPIALLVIGSATVDAQHPAGATPVEVVNHPEVQKVAAAELTATQRTLELLLLRTSGILPAGAAVPAPAECQINSLSEYVETEVVRVTVGRTGCDLETYAKACTAAACRHRRICSDTCVLFRVLGGGQSCRGNDRASIRPFVPERDCRVDREGLATIECSVTGWCSCDP